MTSGLKENFSGCGSCAKIFVFKSSFLEDVLSALRCVIGRKHPSAAQSRKLKQTLPALSVVLDLLLSQVDVTKKNLLCAIPHII